jgi:hypothetical protein
VTKLTLNDDGITPRSRLGRMRSRSLGARPGIRWRILHGRSNYPDLLSSGLSGATRPLGECRVFWFGSRRRAGGLSTMPSLPTQDGTGKPGVEWNCNNGGAVCVLSRKDSWMKPRLPNLPIASVLGHGTYYGCFLSYGCAPERNRRDPACAGCEAADRSNYNGAVQYRLCRWISQRAAVQRRIPSYIWSSAVVFSQDRPGMPVPKSNSTFL